MAQNSPEDEESALRQVRKLEHDVLRRNLKWMDFKERQKAFSADWSALKADSKRLDASIADHRIRMIELGLKKDVTIHEITRYT